MISIERHPTCLLLFSARTSSNSLTNGVSQGLHDLSNVSDSSGRAVGHCSSVRLSKWHSLFIVSCGLHRLAPYNTLTWLIMLIASATWLEDAPPDSRDETNYHEITVRKKKTHKQIGIMSTHLVDSFDRGICQRVNLADCLGRRSTRKGFMNKLSRCSRLVILNK